MKWKKDRKEKKKSKKKSDQIIRIEELEEIIEKYGDDVDPETIVSMYVPHRQPKRLGAALLRMDKLHLVLLGMMLVVCILFIIAFSQEKMGNLRSILIVWNYIEEESAFPRRENLMMRLQNLLLTR